MSAATQLFNLLSGWGPVNGLVADRIYKTIVPDGKATPAISYRRSNTEYVQTIHGPILANKPTFDIYCIAASNSSAEDLGNAVDGGEDGGNALPGVTFIDRIDDYDPDTGLYATIITVTVWQTDVADPAFVSALVESGTPARIRIIMSEALHGVTPVATAFTVSGGKTVTGVAWGDTRMIELTVDSPYAPGDVITVSYAKPTTNPLRDGVGNVAASFGPSAVTNNL